VFRRPPIESRPLVRPLDSLYFIVRCQAGIPVGTAGHRQAGAHQRPRCSAAQSVLALNDPAASSSPRLGRLLHQQTEAVSERTQMKDLRWTALKIQVES